MSRTEELLNYVRSHVSSRELLAVIAEESAELTQAALKLRRVGSKEHPTPKPINELYDNFEEEIADVFLCVKVLGMDISTPICMEKLERWVRRLEAANDRH